MQVPVTLMARVGRNGCKGNLSSTVKLLIPPVHGYQQLRDNDRSVCTGLPTIDAAVISTRLDSVRRVRERGSISLGRLVRLLHAVSKRGADLPKLLHQRIKHLLVVNVHQLASNVGV